MFGLGRHKSYITKEGYKQKYKPKSPEAREDGYVAVHRDVASRKIGRPLRANEVVHHRDGNIAIRQKVDTKKWQNCGWLN